MTTKKQSRRCVSVRGSTYEQIKKYCDRNELSMSEFVEEQVAAFFGNGRAKKVGPLPKIRPEELQDAARFFTF